MHRGMFLNVFVANNSLHVFLFLVNKLTFEYWHLISHERAINTLDEGKQM